LLPLYDDHTMSVLGDENRKFYGTFRVFGAYSWLFGSLIASVIFGRFGWNWLSLYGLIGFSGICVAIYRTPVEKEVGEHRYLDVWKHMFKHPKILNFALGLAAMGWGYGIVGAYLNLYLISDELRAPPVLLGLCTVFTVLFEIPLFQNAERLHRNFSDEQLFMGAVFGYVFRVWAYSVLPNCWLVLLVEPAHAATFGLMWLSGISFLRKSFPKELSNSATGLVHSACFGLGPLISLPLGGSLYEQVGPRNLFRIAGTVLLICGAIFWTVHKNCQDEEVDHAVNSVADSKKSDNINDKKEKVEAEEMKIIVLAQ
jgi:MFS transporter, PPP family, 3-phenylpropionic acid transporter